MIKFKTLVLLLTILNGLSASKTVNKAKIQYRLKMTNFVCSDDNDFIVNLTCRIKPGREKIGFLTMKSFMPKPLDNFIVELRHFYKPIVGRNPQYRPYYFNLDVDWFVSRDYSKIFIGLNF